MRTKNRRPTHPGEILLHEFLKPAVLLGRALKTSPEFWMNLQTALDLYKAEQKLAA